MTIINQGIRNSMILLTQEPLSERMKMATLNTVLGMGIVFGVLAIMIFLISLFKYLPILFSGGKKAENNQDEKATSVKEISADINHDEDTDLMDDNELVAVITAAISAFQSEAYSDNSAGGFVVRSIRRINNRRIS